MRTRGEGSAHCLITPTPPPHEISLWDELTELQPQNRRLRHLIQPEHFHIYCHCGPRVGREEGEEVPGGFAGARVEGAEFGGYASDVFGEHFAGEEEVGRRRCVD